MADVKHYLISIDGFHSYVMSNDDSSLLRVIDKMLDVMKEHDKSPLVPIALCTELDDFGIEVVRGTIRKYDNSGDDKIEELWRTVTNFHFSMFEFDLNSLPNKILNELH